VDLPSAPIAAAAPTPITISTATGVANANAQVTNAFAPVSNTDCWACASGTLRSSDAAISPWQVHRVVACRESMVAIPLPFRMAISHHEEFQRGV